MQRLQLALENSAATRILVTQIDIDFGDLHRPGGDHHAFEKAVRIALEVVAILEGARLALVDIDRHHPRREFSPDDAPLASSGKAGPTQAAQAGILHRLEDGFGVAPPGEALGGDAIAPIAAVLVVADVLADATGGLFRFDDRLDLIHAGARHRILADDRHRRLLAASQAWRRNDPHAIAECAFERIHQSAGARQLARQRIAYAHREGGRCRLPLLHDVEMVVERRHLIDLGHREFHFACQSDDMRG